MAFSGMGNTAIKAAWSNPKPYSSSTRPFQNHHKHPIELGGDPKGPVVTVSGGGNGLPNTHQSGVHVNMHNYLKNAFGVNKWGEAKDIFNNMSNPISGEILMRYFNADYANKLLTPMDWYGIFMLPTSEPNPGKNDK